MKLSPVGKYSTSEEEMNCTPITMNFTSMKTDQILEVPTNKKYTCSNSIFLCVISDLNVE